VEGISNSLEANKPFDPIVIAAPIGDHNPCKTPFFSQNVLQKVRIFIAIGPVDEVVGAHDGARFALFNRNLESGQIDFPERPFIDDRIGGKTPGLLIIAGKMLYAGGDTVGLDALEYNWPQFAREIRIFREIFKVPPTAGIPLHVDARAE
jgi:hypothetical protein